MPLALTIDTCRRNDDICTVLQLVLLLRPIALEKFKAMYIRFNLRELSVRLQKVIFN